jgi:hypothetical protein
LALDTTHRRKLGPVFLEEYAESSFHAAEEEVEESADAEFHPQSDEDSDYGSRITSLKCSAGEILRYLDFNPVIVKRTA